VPFFEYLQYAQQCLCYSHCIGGREAVSSVLEKSMRSLFLLAACLCIMPTAARAQALGVITGSVTDPSGAAVPRAHITATETGTGFERSIATDDTGRYTVPSLRPTEYSLTVEASGFSKYVQKTSGSSPIRPRPSTFN